MNFSGLWLEKLTVCIVCVLGIVCTLCFCKEEKAKLRVAVAVVCAFVIIIEVVSAIVTFNGIEQNTIVEDGVFCGVDKSNISLLWNGYVFEFDDENKGEVLHLNMITARQMELEKLEEGKEYTVAYEKNSRVILSVEEITR